MNRRTFLQTSFAASVAAGLPISAIGATHKIARVGVQLYTVRNAMKTDFDGTIAKVAAIGYKEVEFAGYFDHSAKDIRALLDHNGLVAPSSHVPYEVVENKWPETLDFAHTVGQSFIICPSISEKQQHEPDGYKRAAELFNRAGEASLKAGIQFGYHNHTVEFKPIETLGDKLPYDFLLEATDPKFVKMEMDLCWITAAGKDPLTYFDRYPGRFPLVHVKDWTKDAKMADVGQGAIDWKRIFAQSDKAGIQHYFVENDDTQSPFESLRVSYTYLHDFRG